jgi:hypothetical protein
MGQVLAWCALGFTLSAPSAGCRRHELTLKDSEGRTYSAECSDDGCKVLGTAEPLPHALLSQSRIVAVCEAAEQASANGKSCRPLVCDNDSQCPPAHGIRHGTCVSGVCTEPANPISVTDAVLLCLAGTGWSFGSPLQVQRYALAMNCGSPCRVPSPCRQP